MTLPFLNTMEPGSEHVPIRPVRLAFLVHEALGKVSTPAVPTAEIQEEVWARNSEIVLRTLDAVGEYNEAEDA